MTAGVWFQIHRTFFEGRAVYYQKEVTVTDATRDIECYKCESVGMTSRQASALGSKIVKMAKAGATVKEINKEVDYLLYQGVKKGHAAAQYLEEEDTEEEASSERRKGDD